MVKVKILPLSGFKSVTVPEVAYNKAKQLINLGLEDSLGKAFLNAINEYTKKRQRYIEELETVKTKWSNKL